VGAYIQCRIRLIYENLWYFSTLVYFSILVILVVPKYVGEKLGGVHEDLHRFDSVGK